MLVIYIFSNVAAFAINPAGLLTPVTGSPFAAGTNPLSMTFDATGAFAYVTNRGSNNIYTYSVNVTTGALTEVANSRIATGTTPGSLAIHANGRLAYVTNSNGGSTDGSISAYTINVATGMLTAVAGGAVAAGINPAALVAFHASGKFLYLRNANVVNTAGSVSSYTINQTSGALTPTCLLPPPRPKPGGAKSPAAQGGRERRAQCAKNESNSSNPRGEFRLD